jgi:hypothetical protein
MVPRTGVSGGYSVTINDVMDMANGLLRCLQYVASMARSME